MAKRELVSLQLNPGVDTSAEDEFETAPPGTLNGIELSPPEQEQIADFVCHQCMNQDPECPYRYRRRA